MWKKLQRSLLLCYRAGHQLVGNFGFETAGYLTFLSLLSLFPYLLLMFSVVGIFGQGETGRSLIALLLHHLPADAVTTIRPRIEEITSGPPHGLLTFAILGAIWTSSSAVEAVRGALNRAYRVRKPTAYFARRMLSIFQILTFTLLILVVMLVLVFTPILLQTLTYYTGLQLPFHLEHFFTRYFVYVGAAALLLVVGSFYYVLPNIRQTLTDVAPGAVLVVALWIGSASLVTFYLNRVSQVTLIYGSLSGFIATLIFFYVLIIIFLYGAEFNRELMCVRARPIIEKRASSTPH